MRYRFGSSQAESQPTVFCLWFHRIFFSSGRERNGARSYADSVGKEDENGSTWRVSHAPTNGSTPVVRDFLRKAKIKIVLKKAITGSLNQHSLHTKLEKQVRRRGIVILFFCHFSSSLFRLYF